jgi:hypothetical protein
LSDARRNMLRLEFRPADAVRHDIAVPGVPCHGGLPCQYGVPPRTALGAVSGVVSGVDFRRHGFDIADSTRSASRRPFECLTGICVTLLRDRASRLLLPQLWSARIHSPELTPFYGNYGRVWRSPGRRRGRPGDLPHSLPLIASVYQAQPELATRMHHQPQPGKPVHCAGIQ